MMLHILQREEKQILFLTCLINVVVVVVVEAAVKLV
jgi:hypothetical protein